MIPVCGDSPMAIVDRRFAKTPRPKHREESRGISADRERAAFARARAKAEGADRDDQALARFRARGCGSPRPTCSAAAGWRPACTCTCTARSRAAGPRPGGRPGPAVRVCTAAAARFTTCAARPRLPRAVASSAAASGRPRVVVRARAGRHDAETGRETKHASDHLHRARIPERVVRRSVRSRSRQPSSSRVPASARSNGSALSCRSQSAPLSAAIAAAPQWVLSQMRAPLVRRHQRLRHASSPTALDRGPRAVVVRARGWQ